MDIPIKLPCLLVLPLVGFQDLNLTGFGNVVNFVVANFLFSLKAMPRRPFNTRDAFLEMAQN